jgi:hypothetical protein
MVFEEAVAVEGYRHLRVVEFKIEYDCDRWEMSASL